MINAKLKNTPFSPYEKDLLDYQQREVKRRANEVLKFLKMYNVR